MYFISSVVSNVMNLKGETGNPEDSFVKGTEGQVVW